MLVRAVHAKPTGGYIRNIIIIIMAQSDACSERPGPADRTLLARCLAVLWLLSGRALLTTAHAVDRLANCIFGALLAGVKAVVVVNALLPGGALVIVVGHGRAIHQRQWRCIQDHGEPTYGAEPTVISELTDGNHLLVVGVRLE